MKLLLGGLLLVAAAASTWGVESSPADGHVTFVAELSSKPVQKLSKYRWYSSVRLHRFLVPEGTSIARWNFSVTRGNRLFCGHHNITVHIRWGAPPVINPTGTQFPNRTLWSPSTSLILPVTFNSTKTFNVSYPASGYWFVVAHLPEDDRRIEQKGLPSCTYSFQPQLTLRRAVDTPVLEQGAFLTRTVSSEQPALLKLHVPEFASSLSVFVRGCSSAQGQSCPLLLNLGSESLLQHPLTVECSGSSCSAVVPKPPWDTWLRVVVASSQPNRTVSFGIGWNYTVGCKPQSVGQELEDGASALHHNSSQTNSTSVSNPAAPPESTGPNVPSTAVKKAPHTEPMCVWSVPVLQEELDILSLRFTAVKGPNVSVTHTHPTMLTYPLPPQATGGTLNLHLTLNMTNIFLENTTNVVACFSPWSPVLELNQSQPCRSALFGGYGVSVNSSVTKAALRLPFPLSATWYLTLQLHCNSTSCGNTSVVPVVPELSISPCVDKCGRYGECLLLRSYSFLYAACVCKAGWRGWGCTDNSTALSYSRQIISTLLLTFSNLSFLPAIMVAARRCFYTEASVYIFTMFFSTFYHACDQPGVAVFCIMDYDTLQYCDFLGSVCAIWVTILCMARIRDIVKYTLFMVGALMIAMSMQLDRRGLWNMLGPILCAILLMISTWVYRGVRRKRCYPPSWKRWALYLVPGLCCALVGITLYIFAETEDNYFYIHSLWHILVATCVVFLLPPKEKHRQPLGWIKGFSWARNWRPRICGYTLCEGKKEELHTVT